MSFYNVADNMHTCGHLSHITPKWGRHCHYPSFKGEELWFTGAKYLTWGHKPATGFMSVIPESVCSPCRLLGRETQEEKAVVKLWGNIQQINRSVVIPQNCSVKMRRIMLSKTILLRIKTKDLTKTIRLASIKTDP